MVLTTARLLYSLALRSSDPAERSPGVLGGCQLRQRGKLFSRSPGQRSLCPGSRSSQESARTEPFWDSSQETALQPAPGGLLGGVIPRWSHFTLRCVRSCAMCTHMHTHAPLVCAYLLGANECASVSYALLHDTLPAVHLTHSLTSAVGVHVCVPYTPLT